MYAPSNQIQSPDDDEEDQVEDGDNSKSKDSTIKQPGQETFHSYYNQHFGPTQEFTLKSLDAEIEKWPDFVCSGAASTPSNPMKISYGKLLQEGFNLSVPKLKATKRKAEVIGGGSGGGGRVVQSTGRKDRHSKVSTARGPRDRRVRLSPRTAIQFYDVQDRLGYDRPSKAIDWLITEAKTAIDALDEQPSLEKDNLFIASNAAEYHSPPIPNHGEFLISELCGMIEKHERMNDENPVSGFGFCIDGAMASSSTELQAYLEQDYSSSRNRGEASENVILYPSYQQGFCSATSETNWEMARLQKLLTWNNGNENSGNTKGGGGGEYSSSVNTLPLHSSAQLISGNSHMFSQREPLQSSVMNYSPINADFSGFNFSNELSNITASATQKVEEKDKKLVCSRPSSFLHYDD